MAILVMGFICINKGFRLFSSRCTFNTSTTAEAAAVWLVTIVMQQLYISAPLNQIPKTDSSQQSISQTVKEANLSDEKGDPLV